MRQPFMSRMRSYSSPLRQSNRGTLAPVYQTASMVRASSLADGGAKVAATVKRSSLEFGGFLRGLGRRRGCDDFGRSDLGAVSGAVPGNFFGHKKDSFLLLLIYEV